MKLNKVELLPLANNVADNLLGWKASLMNRAGSLITVKMVFSAIPIYLTYLWTYQNGLLRQLTNVEEAFFGRTRKRWVCLEDWY